MSAVPVQPTKQATVRQRLLRWSVRIILGILGLLVLLIGAGLGYQWLSTTLDRRDLPPLGQRYDVGGFQLHLTCQGEGSPTVILDALGDGTSAHGGWVQPAVAAHTRVCAYDRAGVGWSEPSPAPRDVTTLAGELHMLLAQAGIEGPVIVAGHSFGGMVARIYADHYPEETVGVVLIDTGLPGLRSEAMPAAVHANGKAEEEFMAAAPWLARLGIFRLVADFSSLPEPQRSHARAAYNATTFWEALTRQAQAIPQSDAAWETAGRLGDRPLMIVSATRGWLNPNAENDAERSIYNSLQTDLLTLSTNSAQRVIEGASHASLVLDETHAAATAAAILEVVAAVQTGTPLAAMR